MLDFEVSDFYRARFMPLNNNAYTDFFGGIILSL